MEPEERRRRTEELLASFRPTSLPPETLHKLERTFRDSQIAAPRRHSILGWKWSLAAACLAAAVGGLTYLSMGLGKYPAATEPVALNEGPRGEERRDSVLPVKTVSEAEAEKPRPAPLAIPKMSEPSQAELWRKELERDSDAARKLAEAGRIQEALELWRRAEAIGSTRDAEACQKFQAVLESTCQTHLAKDLEVAKRALTEGREQEAQSAAERFDAFDWPPAAMAAAALRAAIGARRERLHRLEEEDYQGLIREVALARKEQRYDVAVARIEETKGKIHTPAWSEELLRLKHELECAAQVLPLARQSLQARLGQSVSLIQKDGTIHSGKMLACAKDHIELEVERGIVIAVPLQALDPAVIVSWARQAQPPGAFTNAGLALYLLDAGSPDGAARLLTVAGAGNRVSQTLAQGVAQAKDEARRRWKSAVHGKVKDLGGDRVAVSYDFRDPKQLDDWTITGGAWHIEADRLVAERGQGELRLPLTGETTVRVRLVLNPAGLAQASNQPEWLREVAKALIPKSGPGERPPFMDPLGVKSMSVESPLAAPSVRNSGRPDVQREVEAELILHAGRSALRVEGEAVGAAKRELYRGAAFKQGVVLNLAGSVWVLNLVVEGQPDLDRRTKEER